MTDGIRSVVSARPRRAGLAALLLAALPLAAGAQVLPEDDRRGIEELDLADLLDTTVEAGALHAERSSETSASVFVLTDREIREQGYTTLLDALRSVPGLFGHRDGLVPMLGVRGVGLLGDYMSRVLVLLDGHPLNGGLSGIGQSWLGPDFPVPLEAVRRVEVLKGPMGALHGPDAFLAVVNVVTGRAPGHGGLASAFGEATDAGVGGGGGSVVVRSGAGPVEILAAAEASAAPGPDLAFPELAGDPSRPAPPGGVVPGMAFTDAQRSLLQLSLGGASLTGTCGRWFTGLPSAPYGSILLDDRTHQEVANCLAALSLGGQPAPGLDLAARLGFHHFQFRDAYAYAPPPEDLGVFRDSAFERRAWGELRATWRPDAATTLVAGARLERHWTSQYVYSDSLPGPAEDPVNGVGAGPIRKDYSRADAVLLGQRQLGPSLRLDGALSWSWNELFGGRVTPRAALRWAPTAALAAKVIYSEGFRAPTVVEAFYEDGTDFLSNPALGPEVVRSFEVVVEGRLGEAAVVTGSLHASRFQDLIRYESVPAPGLPGETRLQARNGAFATVHGGELAVNARLWGALQAYGGIAAQFAGEEVREGFPSWTANAAVSWRTPWRLLLLAANAVALAPRDKDAEIVPAGASARVPAAVVLGCAATLGEDRPGGLALQLSASNLLDAAAPHPVTGDFAPLTEHPEWPRTLRLTLRWRFP